MPKAPSANLVVGLSSGAVLTVQRVLLFPEAALRELVTLRAKAQEALGGFSTGVGFLGSPGWVLGAATVLGAVEAGISDSKARKGLEILKDVAVKRQQLIDLGVYFDISEIISISHPMPEMWRAVSTLDSDVDLRRMGFLEKSEAIDKYKPTKQQIKDGAFPVTLETPYAHSGEDFVNVEADSNRIAVRWTDVQTFQLAAR